MQITLINPPHEESLDPKLDPPLGLMYIASVLEKNGYRPKIVDLCFYERKDWKKAIGFADIYGITILTPSYYRALEILKICKENNPKALVVAGGAHPTALPHDTLKDGFDVVVKGEGEYAMLNLVKLFEKGSKDYSSIIIGEVKNIDDLPFPARHLVPIKEYTRKVFGVRATSIIASRGCPYRCAFCANDPEDSVFKGKVRFRSVDSVVEEIKEVMKLYGFRHFIFYDDTFTLNPDLENLCDKLRRLYIVFRCNGDLRRDSFKTFKMLYRAGCREIAFGVESGSQEVLNKVRKGTKVERNKKVIKMAKKAGLIVKTYLMVGCPGETWETVEETRKFVSEVKPHQWTLFNFTPIPGCDIFKNPSKYGIILKTKDWRAYFNIAGKNVGGLTHDIVGGLSAEEIDKARKYLLNNLPKQKGLLQDYYKRLLK